MAIACALMGGLGSSFRTGQQRVDREKFLRNLESSKSHLETGRSDSLSDFLHCVAFCFICHSHSIVQFV